MAKKDPKEVTASTATEDTTNAAAPEQANAADQADQAQAKAADPQPEPAAPAPATEKATLVPCNNGLTEASDRAIQLLLEACEKFGVNPTMEQRPRELASWNFYPASQVDGVPAAVVIVTKGGVKLKHYADPSYPMDRDTQETLVRIFRAFVKDPVTKELVEGPLPTDLALPFTAVTGTVQAETHRYRRGYLAEGGKAAADQRDQDQKKTKRK
jgi:hypothetical protein